MAELVRVDTQPWGVVWEVSPSRILAIPVAGVVALLSYYTLDEAGAIIVGDPVTLYDDPLGLSDLADPFVTSALGGFPGYVERGRYVIEVAGGEPIMVEASSGAADATGGGSDPVEAWQDLTAYMTMANWTDYDVGLTFYKDRERVYFQGVVSADVAGTAVLVNSLPVGYRPTTRNVFTQLHTSYDSTSVATRGHHWEVSITAGGQIAFNSNPTFSASPNFGRPPASTVFNLADLSFRIN